MKVFKKYNFLLLTFYFAQAVSCQSVSKHEREENWRSDIDTVE